MCLFWFFVCIYWHYTQFSGLCVSISFYVHRKDISRRNGGLFNALWRFCQLGQVAAQLLSKCKLQQLNPSIYTSLAMQTGAQLTSISLVQMPFTLEFFPLSCLHDKLTTLDLYLLQPQLGTVSAIWGPWFFLIPVIVWRAPSGAAARMPQLKQVGPSCGSTCLSMCLESHGLPMDPQLIETWPQIRLENHPWTRD